MKKGLFKDAVRRSKNMNFFVFRVKGLEKKLSRNAQKNQCSATAYFEQYSTFSSHPMINKTRDKK